MPASIEWIPLAALFHWFQFHTTVHVPLQDNLIHIILAALDEVDDGAGKAVKDPRLKAEM